MTAALVERSEVVEVDHHDHGCVPSEARSGVLCKCCTVEHPGQRIYGGFATHARQGPLERSHQRHKRHHAGQREQRPGGGEQPEGTGK